MSSSASSTSEPRDRLIAAAPIAPIVAPGNANTADWLSKPIMPITIEPKPYALRSVTSNLGDGRHRLRREHARAAAQDAAPLRRGAGQHAGVVGEEDQRQVERVGDGDEVRGLVGAVDVDRARDHLGLVGDDRDRVAAEVRERGDHRTCPKSGCTSNHDDWSTTTSITSRTS